MPPTTPNASVTLMYRYLNTAWVRWGLSSGHTGYVIELIRNSTTIGMWIYPKAYVEVGDHCEFDLGQLEYAASNPYITEYSTTYIIKVYGHNTSGNVISSGTTPATLTMAPQLPSFDFSRTGSTLNVTLSSSFNLNWSYVVCAVYDDGVPIDGFSITNPSRTYGITGLDNNTWYEIRAYAVYVVNGTPLTSVDYYGDLYINEQPFFFQGPRPSNFIWDNPKVSEEPYNLTAVEWNKYLSRLKDFVDYTGFVSTSGSYSPVYVNPGDVFAEDIYNDVISTLVLYAEGITISDRVLTGNIILALHLNKIVTAMNDIEVVYY